MTAGVASAVRQALAGHAPFAAWDAVLALVTLALLVSLLWRAGTAAWRAGRAAEARGRRIATATLAAAAACRHPLGLAALAWLLVAVRLLHLPADPPVDLGPSGGHWTDPGEWAHNARNKILYGTWVWDEVNFMYLSPLTNACFYLVFRLLGVGYVQVGLVSVLFSLATLPLFYLALRATFGRGGALLATGLLGGSFLYVTYNRVGLVETPAIFFQVLTLYLAERGVRDPRGFALAGAASVMPLAVKMQMTYIFPAALLSVLLWSAGWPPRPGEKRSLRPLGLFLAGAAAALAVLAAVWLVPYREEIVWRLANESRLHALPTNVPRLLRNVFANPFFVYFLASPVLVLLAGLFFCGLLVRLLRGQGPVAFPQLFAFWWFVGGFSYLAVAQYRPLRYYVSLVAPLAILAASAMLALWRDRAAAGGPPGALAVWVYGGAAFLAALPAVGYGYARVPAVQDALAYAGLYPLTASEQALLTGAVVLVMAAAIFRTVGPRLAGWAARMPPWAPRALAVLLVAALLAGEVAQYLQWTRNRTYKLVTISRDLGARLPPGSVLAGIFAPILTLENRHRSLAIWDRYGNWRDDSLRQYGVTHVAVMAYVDEIGYYQRRFPEAMRRARLLDEWILWKTRVSLYELPPAR